MRKRYQKIVVALIEKSGKILIGKKIFKRGHFLSSSWHIPGGHVKIGESEKSALVREMEEETGLKVRVLNKIGEIRIKQKHMRVIWYRCRPISGNIRAGGDISQLQFVYKSEGLKLFPKPALKYWPMEIKFYFKIKKF